jgi:choline dehydrogenase
MQDHLDFASIWEIEGIPEAGITDEEPYGSGQLIEEYRVNRTGALTSAPVVYLGWEKLPDSYRGNLSASARADLANFPADWPELE